MALASDGVAEVSDTFGPRQVERGRLGPSQQAIHLLASDTESSWILGPGAPPAMGKATVESLLQMLWSRLSTDDPIKWEGDCNCSVLLGPRWCAI